MIKETPTSVVVVAITVICWDESVGATYGVGVAVAVAEAVADAVAENVADAVAEAVALAVAENDWLTVALFVDVAVLLEVQLFVKLVADSDRVPLKQVRVVDEGHKHGRAEVARGDARKLDYALDAVR